jgi:hypothetical protein
MVKGDSAAKIMETANESSINQEITALNKTIDHKFPEIFSYSIGSRQLPFSRRRESKRPSQ